MKGVERWRGGCGPLVRARGCIADRVVRVSISNPPPSPPRDSGWWWRVSGRGEGDLQKKVRYRKVEVRWVRGELSHSFADTLPLPGPTQNSSQFFIGSNNRIIPRAYDEGVGGLPRAGVRSAHAPGVPSPHLESTPLIIFLGEKII